MISFRDLSKTLIWSCLNRHRPGDAHSIALFASRRSGSTLWMEVLAANAGVKFVNQPLSIFSLPPKDRKELPHYPGGLPFAPPAHEKERLHRYLLDILEGRRHVAEPWRFWRGDFRFRSDRLVLKFTNAHGIAGWIQDSFNVAPLVGVRHPLPQSLSVWRNGWGFQGKGLLQSAAFVERYLSPDQLKLARYIFDSEATLDKYVMDWCLENRPLLDLQRKHGWPMISYEEFVLHTEAVIRSWSALFSLPDTDRMIRASARASRSTRRQSDSSGKQAIERHDPAALIGRWRSEVIESEEYRLLEMVGAMGIHLYVAGQDLPNHSWLQNDKHAAR